MLSHFKEFCGILSWPSLLCVTDSCQQSKQCCRSPFRRSPRRTSVCRWRTRSFCGNSTTETWIAPAGYLLHRLPPPTPSASSHLAAPTCFPALLYLPDNNGQLLPVSRPLLSYPLELRAKCFSSLLSNTTAWCWFFQDQLTLTLSMSEILLRKRGKKKMHRSTS